MILTLFYVFAAAMMALLGYGLLKSILDPSIRDETNHRDVNVGIARDRKALIKDALSKGHIDQDTYEVELRDIESTLAADLTGGPNNTQSRVMRTVGVLFIVGLLTAVTVVLYQRLGNKVAMQDQFLAQSGSVIMASGATVNQQVASALQAGADPKTVAADVVAAASQAPDQNANSLQELLPQLEARLAENPDDLQGWTLLARTYMNTGDFEKAEAALLKVNELDDTNPEMLIMLAEAGALQKQGALAGEPQALIKKALAIDPNNQRGQLLLGLSHQQLGEHESAIDIFQSLRANPLLSPQGVANLTQMIEQSQAAMGQASGNASDQNQTAQSAQTTQTQEATTASDASDATAAEQANAESPTAISVSVTLSDTAASAVNDNDSVFIFARASAGPPMPLAVVRMQVSDLPSTVTLDDTQAMIPDMTLSTFPSVTISARVSSSGDAIAKPGDWFGAEENVITADADPNDTIRIVIDQQTP